MFLSFPPASLSFAEQRRKEFSFEKELVSACNGWSGNIIEGKEECDWIEIGSCFCRDQGMKIQNHFKLRHNLKTNNAEITVLPAQHIRFMQVNITRYRAIFSPQNVL
jgi:hypothetical protein